MKTRLANRSLVAVAVVLALVACTHNQRPTTSSQPSPTQVAAFEDSLSKTQITLDPAATPPGATLAVQQGSNPLPPPSTAVVRPLTTPVDITLSGKQPLKPASVTATLRSPLPKGTAVWLVTQHTAGGTVDLLPATYDSSTRTLRAAMPHFSLAFFATIDVKSVLNEITKAFTGTFGLSKARPSCSGKPLVVDSVRYTLPSRYLSSGDGVLWPCLRWDGNKVNVELTAASGLPYLVRVSPKATLTYGGTVDIGKAVVLAGYRELVRNPPYDQGLLVPGGAITYAFNGSALPGLVAARLDLGTHLALSAVWAVQYLLTIFKIHIALLEMAEVLGCIGDAVEAATPPDKVLSGDGIGAVLKAAISCAGQVIKAARGVVSGLLAAILSVLAGGVGIAIAGFQGALLTALRHDTTTLRIGRSLEASLADSPFVGEWFVHGGGLEVRADGTATVNYRWGWCTSNPSEDCSVEQSLSARLSTDGKTLTLTVRKVRYLGYLNQTARVLTNPPADMVASSEQPGATLRFRFTAANVIKDIDKDENQGNPYYCNVDHPPADNGPCGA